MSFIGARVYNSSNITVPTSTWTALTFNSERWDSDGIHSTSSNTSRLTCQTAGKYLVSADIQWAVGATATRIMRVYLNGATPVSTVNVGPVSQGYPALNTATVLDLDIGDYIEVKVWQNTGGSKAVSASAQHSPEFMMVLLDSSSASGYNDIVDMDDFTGSLEGMAGRPLIVNQAEDGFEIADNDKVVVARMFYSHDTGEE